MSEVQVSNPDSPLMRLPRSSLVDVQVKSVTPMNEGTAMVRFDTQRRDAGGQAHPAQPWVAIVRYGYSGEPMSAADRMINPLGFKVSSYRKSVEALTSAEPTAVTAPAAGIVAAESSSGRGAGPAVHARP